MSHSFCSSARYSRSASSMSPASLRFLESASQSAQNGMTFQIMTCVPNRGPMADARMSHTPEMRPLSPLATECALRQTCS